MFIWMSYEVHEGNIQQDTYHFKQYFFISLFATGKYLFNTGS